MVEGTARKFEHSLNITAETPSRPSGGDMIPKGLRSRKEIGGLSSFYQAIDQLERFLVDQIFAIDLAIDRICNCDHSLIVVENPANLSSLSIER